jgi:hypothetical protein
VRRRVRAVKYLDAEDREIHWAMMRDAMSSVANTAIVRMQDLLGRACAR